MFKFRKIEFINHRILGNLVLDFCDQNGKAADTVIIAGENGVGKSKILNELFSISSNHVPAEINLEYEEDGTIYHIKAFNRETDPSRPFGPNNSFTISDTRVKNPALPGGWGINPSIRQNVQGNPFTGIFSDVEINFNTGAVSSVTNMALDTSAKSYRSTPDFPKELKQLLIDIQAMDDADLASAVRENPDKTRSELRVEERIPRFTRAFNSIFDVLVFKKVESTSGHKAIIFSKYGSDIQLESLSSGEKQIVFRGCFLLKDKEALNGAFVFIDEPEISLHPSWQKKIMDFYKGIFTNADGVQTSQIFAVTHSPFIIHNESRKNDKVIVLKRDEDGKIIVEDKPEYYKCSSVEAVQDAFDIHSFLTDQPTVYLEGRTDEKYFKKALDVFGLEVPFQFRWIGHLDDTGNESFTGSSSLDKAFSFLVGRNFSQKSVCLFDCDTHKDHTEKNNAIAICLDQYENAKSIKAGIENALIFGDINIEPFRKYKESFDPKTGMNRQIPEFDKMACCDYICSLETEQLQSVLIHLKEIVETKLLPLFNTAEIEQPE